MPKKPRQSARMKRFSTLAGTYRTLPKKGAYKVVFETLIGREPFSYQFGVRMLAGFGFTLVLLFAAILFWPAHWVIIQEPTSPVHLQNMVMLGILMALQLLVIIGAFFFDPFDHQGT